METEQVYLAPHLRELFEERAAIMEYDANLPRVLAESLAWAEITRIQEQDRNGQ